METSGLVLCPDGTGWSTLENAAGADAVTRFRWSSPRPGLLVLAEESYSEAGGPPEPASGTVRTGYRFLEEVLPDGEEGRHAGDGWVGRGEGGDQGGRVAVEFEQPVEFINRYVREKTWSAQELARITSL
jgi:hypothetical protein